MLTLRSWYGAARCVVGRVVARLGITVDVTVELRPVDRPLPVPRRSLGCIYSSLLGKEYRNDVRQEKRKRECGNNERRGKKYWTKCNTSSDLERQR